jgi:urease accessory protein
MAFNLEPNSHVLLTTAAAGKIYRSLGQVSKQQVQILLAPGTILEWFPQETILFEGALFEQQIQVELGEGAIWAGMELLRFGRTARGEQLGSGQWRGRTEVWHQGQPLWLERSVLRGETSQNLNALGGYSVVGTLVVVGCGFEKEALAFLRQTCLPPRPRNHRLGLTRLPSGVLCRYLGHSTAEGRAYFLKIWENLRQLYAGCGICIPRVWQVCS